MMVGRYVQIKDGVVVNVTRATPAVAAERELVPHDKAGPGWLVEGEELVPPQAPAQPNQPDPVQAKLQALEDRVAALENTR
jgi:hypothetical protein